MAYIELVSRTYNTLTCGVVGLPSWVAGINWYIGTSTGSMPFNQSRDAANTTWTFERVEHPERPGTGFAMTNNTLYFVKFAAYDANGVRHDDLQPVITDCFATLWEWDSDVTAGAEFGITAAEFNRFIDLVFAADAGIATAAQTAQKLTGSASQYYVTRNTGMLASQVNNVRSLIATLGASVPSAAVRGGRIKASFFNGLVSSLYTLI